MKLQLIKLKKILRWFRRTKVKAVYENDLNEMLASLGVLEKIKNDEVICYCCSQIIHLNNIYSFFYKNGEIKFLCSNKDCINKYG